MRTASENRELLLDAARRLLKRKGLANPVQSITLREAYEEAGVPQQSAYRLYQGSADPPQVAFRNDVLAQLLTGDPIASFSATQHQVVDHLTANQKIIRSGSPYEMGVVFREMMRLSTNAWMEAAGQSEGYGILLNTAVAARYGEADSISASLVQSAEAPVSMHRGIHDAVNEMFGIRYTEGHTAGRIIAIWGSLVAGSITTAALNPEVEVIYRDTGANREPQPWTTTGLLCEALTVRVMEPDPDADRSMSFEALTESRWVAPPRA